VNIRLDGLQYLQELPTNLATRLEADRSMLEFRLQPVA
jgi:hypothetical protein